MNDKEKITSLSEEALHGIKESQPIEEEKTVNTNVYALVIGNENRELNMSVTFDNLNAMTGPNNKLINDNTIEEALCLNEIDSSKENNSLDSNNLNNELIFTSDLNNENNSENNSNTDNNDTSAYICQHCDKKFEFASLLNMHLCPRKIDNQLNRRKKYFEKENKILSKRKTYMKGRKTTLHVCDICKKTFPYLSCLQIHSRSHQPKIKRKTIIKKNLFKEDDITKKTNIAQTNSKTNNDGFVEKRASRHRLRKKEDKAISEAPIMTDDGLYVCRLCNKKFLHSSVLDLHSRSHSRQSKLINILENDENVHFCEICKRPFRFLNWLKLHLRTHTKDQKLIKKEIKDKEISEENINTILNEKMEEEKQLFCEICNRQYKNIHWLTSHLKSHKKDQVIIKEVNQDEEIAEQNIITILNKSKLEKKELFCEICKKRYKNVFWLNIHLETHTTVLSKKEGQDEMTGENKLNEKIEEEKQLFCEICNRQYKSIYWLKIHLNSHTKEQVDTKNESQDKENIITILNENKLEKKELFCEICKKRYKNVFWLNIHLETHTTVLPKKGSQDEISGENKFNEKMEEEKQLFCEMCNRQYKSIYWLKIHLKLHTKDKEIEGENFLKRNIKKSINQYDCDICQRSFKFSGRLQLHLLEHKKNVQQEEIPEKIIKRNRRKLVAQHHCHICQRSFKYSARLKIHLLEHKRKKILISNEKYLIKKEKNKQTANSIHTCLICNQSFKYLSGLKLHKLSKHKQSKLLTHNITTDLENDNKTIKTTKNTFNSNKTLIKMAKNNLLQCNICSKRFKNRNQFNKHKQIHLLKGTSLTCLLCSKIYYTKKYLKKHLYKIHSLV